MTESPYLGSLHENRGLSVKQHQGSELFAFSVLGFQRKRVSPALIYNIGRSKVKGFNSIVGSENQDGI